MRNPTASLALVGSLAFLVALAPEARGEGTPPGTLASCQTAFPSGAPISITFSGTGVDASAGVQTIGSLTLTASFHGVDYGPFTLTNLSFVGAGNLMEAACIIFGTPIVGTDGVATTSLSDEIVAAFGLNGSLKFTACSYLGATAPDCTLKIPPGTIHTPLGLLFPTGTTVVGQVTGYASH